MAEYIEREALKAKAVYMHGFGENKYVPLKAIENAPAADAVSLPVVRQIQWERDIAMQQLEEHGIPFCGKADIVPVVRCKDCKYRSYDYDCVGNHLCEKRGNRYYCEDNDFCSYGERR